MFTSNKNWVKLRNADMKQGKTAGRGGGFPLLSDVNVAYCENLIYYHNMTLHTCTDLGCDEPGL